MGVRSSILTRLPRELRLELEKRLVEKSFSGYEDLTQWLNGLGYRISRGALNRYGIRFERRLEAVAAASEQARALAEAAADDDGMATEALVRLVQQRLFSVLIETEGPIGQIDLARLARTISDLSRTTITHQRWMAASQDRLEQQRRAATGQLAELERTGGLSDAAVQTMRDILLGIDPFAPVSRDRGRAERVKFFSFFFFQWIAGFALRCRAHAGSGLANSGGPPARSASVSRSCSIRLGGQRRCALRGRFLSRARPAMEGLSRGMASFLIDPRRRRASDFSPNPSPKDGEGNRNAERGSRIASRLK